MHKIHLAHEMQGHSDFVTAVAMTPRGSRAISASSDTTLKIWDLEKHTELCTLRGHTGSVRGAALTRRGHYAVSVSSDKTLRGWDLGDSGNDGVEVHTLRGHTDAVSGVAIFEPEDFYSGPPRQAVSASFDGTIRLWDLKEGAEPCVIGKHNGGIYRVVITEDRQYLLSAPSDKELKVWGLRSLFMGPLNLTGHKHTDDITAIAVDRVKPSKTVVTGSIDGTVSVWNLPNTLRYTFEGVGRVLGVATGYGKSVVVASGDEISVWDLESHSKEASFKNGDRFYDCAVTQDERTIIAGGEDGIVYVLHYE